MFISKINLIFNFSNSVSALFFRFSISPERRCKEMGVRFIKAAVVYFLIGLGVGIYMSSSQDLRFGSLHAHINLVGWVSMALFGVIYRFFPKASSHKLATIHLWLYNIGLPVFLFSLFMLLRSGSVKWEWGIIPSAFLIILAVICFLINVFTNVSESQESSISSTKNTSV
jgi:FtsH-binding integral membrane protein